MPNSATHPATHLHSNQCSKSTVKLRSNMKVFVCGSLQKNIVKKLTKKKISENTTWSFSWKHKRAETTGVAEISIGLVKRC